MLSSTNVIELKCGCKLPFVTDACVGQKHEPKPIRMPVLEGRLGDLKVKVLRDTGCSTVVVKADLVKDEEISGHTERCVLIDGTVRQVQ